MSLGQTSNSKQAAWVAIGSFFSFIVSIISSMILSRFFDKGDYGTYKQVMYVYSTLLAVFTLGLPKAYAYFLPKYATNYSRDIISKVTKIFFILGAAFSLFLFVLCRPDSIRNEQSGSEVGIDRVFSNTISSVAYNGTGCYLRIFSQD